MHRWGSDKNSTSTQNFAGDKIHPPSSRPVNFPRGRRRVFARITRRTRTSPTLVPLKYECELIFGAIQARDANMADSTLQVSAAPGTNRPLQRKRSPTDPCSFAPGAPARSCKGLRWPPFPDPSKDVLRGRHKCMLSLSPSARSLAPRRLLVGRGVFSAPPSSCIPNPVAVNPHAHAQDCLLMRLFVFPFVTGPVEEKEANQGRGPRRQEGKARPGQRTQPQCEGGAR